jgi:hypothetical protein
MAGVFSDIFLFVKMYDPVQEKLTYMGRFYCPKGAKPQVSAHRPVCIMTWCCITAGAYDMAC